MTYNSWYTIKPKQVFINSFTLTDFGMNTNDLVQLDFLFCFFLCFFKMYQTWYTFVSHSVTHHKSFCKNTATQTSSPTRSCQPNLLAKPSETDSNIFINIGMLGDYNESFSSGGGVTSLTPNTLLWKERTEKTRVISRIWD